MSRFVGMPRKLVLAQDRMTLPFRPWVIGCSILDLSRTIALIYLGHSFELTTWFFVSRLTCHSLCLDLIYLKESIYIYISSFDLLCLKKSKQLLNNLCQSRLEVRPQRNQRPSRRGVEGVRLQLHPSSLNCSTSTYFFEGSRHTTKKPFLGGFLQTSGVVFIIFRFLQPLKGKPVVRIYTLNLALNLNMMICKFGVSSRRVYTSGHPKPTETLHQLLLQGQGAV